MAEIETLKNRLLADNTYLQEEIRTNHHVNGIVGTSPILRHVLHEADQVARTDATVLILGETGTGKELLARAIHAKSARCHRPLVKVNCATLPGPLIESELFGHERGAFTGAVKSKVGRFELAHGGTIFLDEIGDLPLDLQAKLLRVLQDGEFERVGSTQTTKVNVRVLAATNRDLEDAVRGGRYRPDLYYRLRVIPIQLPPLRDRQEDIPLLVWSFVEKASAKLGKTIRRMPPRVMKALQTYEWPGNVRELENVIERAVILSPGPTLAVDELFTRDSIGRSSGHTRQELHLSGFERSHIVKVLELCHWKVKGAGNAAAQLGLHPSTLRARMAKLGITRPGRSAARTARSPIPPRRAG